MLTRILIKTFTLVFFIFGLPAFAGTISRVTDFSDGDVLTAAQLNSEFNNVVDGVNSINDDNIIAGAAIVPSKISASIAGDGLGRDGSTGVLEVKVDDSTIEINSDTLRVKDSGITSAKILDGTVVLADLASSLISYFTPTGVVQAYGGTSAPTGWLLADGACVSRSTYSALFAVIAEKFGQCDDSTTFAVPDLRSQFIRGTTAATVTISAVDTGAESLTSTAHGLNRTGMKVRIASSGTVPGGTSASITYYLIVTDANTVSLATTRANASTATKVNLSSAGTGTITLRSYEEVDTTRLAPSLGGATTGVGSMQEVGTGDASGAVDVDANGSHAHTVSGRDSGASGTGSVFLTSAGSVTAVRDTSTVGDHTHTLSGFDNETRPTNVDLNFIIKF